MNKLTNHLKLVLVKRNWNQSKLADEAKIPRGRISEIINGHRALSLENAEKIAEVLGEEVVDLLIMQLEDKLKKWRENRNKS